MAAREVAPCSTHVRVAWACRASLERFLFERAKTPPPPTSKPLEAGFVAKALEILAPLEKHLSVSTTEVRMMGTRDSALLESRQDLRQLSQLLHVKRLLNHAFTDAAISGVAFYNFIYAYCQDVELLTQWAERLLEVQ